MLQQPRLPLWFTIVNLALVALAFAMGVSLATWRREKLPQPQATALELIYGEILRSHVDQQDGAVLLDRAIAAMAQVDEYSAYIPPRHVANYEENSTGHYEGIGIVQMQHGEVLVVHFPFAGGPAEQAGILPGDRLLAVDGTEVAELPTAERTQRIRDLVRGPAGSEVRLRLARNGEQLEVAVRRGGVQRPAVKWAQHIDEAAGLGYIYISDFHRGVANELRQAIDALNATARLRGLILDLRQNRGGSLDECIAMARMFQPDGTIVSTRRRDQILDVVRADPTACSHPDLPLVVLIDRDSASASEVLAGCLQDHRRAAIVGERSFGKGFVNTVYTWKDLPFRLKLTTAHYYTPNGRNIDAGPKRRQPHSGPDNGDRGGGIEPDHVAPIDAAVRQQIKASLLEFEPPPAHRQRFAAVAAEYGFELPGPPQPANDPQLAKALEVLRQRRPDTAARDR